MSAATRVTCSSGRMRSGWAICATRSIPVAHSSNRCTSCRGSPLATTICPTLRISTALRQHRELLGLVLSMIMSFPLAAVRKKEDETLTLIDAFCTEKLLPRLNDSKHTTSNGLLEQADSIPELVSSLARAHETFLVNLNEATRQLRDSGDTLNSRLAAHQQTVEASFTEAIKKLSDSSSDVFLRSGMELNRTFEKIANGIDLINHALRDLGQNQIPVEAKKKRGFFSRR